MNSPASPILPGDAFEPATVPTMYFVGVTTHQSAINRVFPRWAEKLGLDGVLRGMNFALHDDPEHYRRAVDFIKSDPQSLGALVTTHKMDLFSAAQQLFDHIAPGATILAEVSSIYKRDGELRGRAVDDENGGLSLDAIIPRDYWAQTGADLLLLGAGGSSVALTMHLMERADPDHRPQRILVTNRSQPRLAHMEQVHKAINPGIAVEYFHCPTAPDNDAVAARLKPGSIIVNATGLGKDAPGSPLTDAAIWPGDAIAWDFNYRGDLVFLDQARAASVRAEDGWIFFLHGWTRVMADVFDLDIPTAGPVFDALSEIAAEER